ncbi:UDP-glucose 4-epimerase [Desulfatibacillum alkenivorans DSM 16219]|jgi:UDP-glucose 4-epimerase|uniref:UDP-glucose 4-epimerase n=1 Tax=Desulfatibacillum alkenivorans DSM 16219 TaxID=1121393 RepID=A0A1M6LSP6_9BACT|nr:NAD-dependent epimerase/dehydratase family protein [Desulfatibacillum alkenivorans]SHJ74241.1 UDP-glucose 4-epimerase [Desulfatibacillum alkenivorans DSM 16219]
MPKAKKTETVDCQSVETIQEKKRPQVLVTGAAGVLAQETINRLSQKKYGVVAIDFRRAVQIGDDIPSYKVDFLKRGFEDIFRQHKFDAVIHLGRVGTDIGGSHFRHNANVRGTQKLFDLCVKYEVGQVIVLSSFFVYGASAYNPALLDEDTPLKASDLSLNLIDTVELDNLSQIYMYKYRRVRMKILRPCNIAGPGVRNNIGRLLSRKVVPVLWGFNPVMQFLHVSDMADAIVKACGKPNTYGIFNVAPNDWAPYKEVLRRCDIIGVPMVSIPDALPMWIARMAGWEAFPSYLVNYFKYPVIVDGSRFAKAFNFSPRRSLEEIFLHYREMKTRRWV